MQRMLILLVFVYAGCVKAQINAQLFVDTNPQFNQSFQDSLALYSHLNKLQIKWVNQGFFFSGVDSIIQQSSDTYSVYIHKGEKSFLEIEGKRNRRIGTKLRSELDEYANNGYPFASIKLDSIEIDDEGLKGVFAVSQGPKITYDSAFFFNELKTNKGYIFKLLDIVPGEDFSERTYREIRRKVERSPFLRVNRSTDISFRSQKAKVFLDLEELNANTFQGVFGLQQNPSGQTSFVGNLDLDITNLFRSGKKFRFGWERFSEESQRLNLYYKHPFFLDSKISPSFRFDLLKQDTTFITRTVVVGIQTFISAKKELSIAYEQTGGSLLSNDLDRESFSGLADYSRNLYQIQVSEGIEFLYQSYQRGVAWSTSLAAGRKEVRKNLSLPDEFYDTIQFNTNFYRMEAILAYQVLMLKRQSVFHSISFGSLINNELLNNELFRIGGLTSLRGFNEKALFAKDYLLSRLEVRSFFEQQSYAYLFYDQLFFSKLNRRDTPFGLGMGFNLATSAGQFSFALAVGKSEFQPISSSAVKIHFGYISRF